LGISLVLAELQGSGHMPGTFEKSVKENVIIHQTPKLQADVREQRKKEALQKIFYALERRYEESLSSKP